jgi:beta-phosphoglucomutase-like phosphatase (HAD superfamily)
VDLTLIIELEGCIADTEPAHWHAYSQAANGLGLPRTDQATFRRVVRTAAPVGQMLKNIKPRHAIEYATSFDALIETDETVDLFQPQGDVVEVVSRLNKIADCVLVTAGANRQARQRFIDANDLGTSFLRLGGLSKMTDRRPQQLLDLTEGRKRVVVAASSPALVTASVAAQLLVVGISNGMCTGRRLTQAGALLTFADLAELAEELSTGAQQLISCGLLPVEHQHKVEFVTPNHDRSSIRRRRR